MTVDGLRASALAEQMNGTPRSSRLRGGVASDLLWVVPLLARRHSAAGAHPRTSGDSRLPPIPLTASRAAGLMLVATGAAFTLKR
jgi:hypothetical protein